MSASSKSSIAARLLQFGNQRVAAVFMLIVLSYIIGILCLLMNSKRNADFLSTICVSTAYALLFSLLAWGCLRRSKFAYWASALLLGLEVPIFMTALPDQFKFISNTVRSGINWGQQMTFQEFCVTSFYYMALIVIFLRMVALLLLPLRSTREAFGIGKAAQV